MADGESFDRRPDRAPAPARRGGGGGLIDEIKKVPLWVWPIAAIVVFFVVRAFLSNQASATTAADTSGSASSGSGASGDATASDQNGAPTSGPDVTPSGAVQQPAAKQPAPTPPPAKVPPPAPASRGVHVVQSGETLNEIAQANGVAESQLYSSNQSTIESTARAHGMPSSQDGWWIFPGERLTIP